LTNIFYRIFWQSSNGQEWQLSQSEYFEKDRSILIMEQFWKIFWRLFAAALAPMFPIALILGVIGHSSEITYTLIQQSSAVALGICGIIGFIVVPVELFMADRKQRNSV
jgi:hypothetical protein